MSRPDGDLAQLVRSMQPRLNSGIYAYCTVPYDAAVPYEQALAVFRESEDVTLILAEEAAHAAGLPVLFRAAWITLEVNSALAAVGFTAAFAQALGAAGISCNVIAAVHHDHVFVPMECAQQALACLRALQTAGIS